MTCLLQHILHLESVLIFVCVLIQVVFAEGRVPNNTTHQLEFTADFFTNNIPLWENLFTPTIAKGKDLEIHVLEIGCFEGRSSLWFLENVMQHPKSHLTCIDTFEDSFEHNVTHKTGLQERYIHNTMSFRSKITIVRNKSYDGLLDKSVRSKLYDIIYIDGSHVSKNVLEDAVLSFSLLRVNGIMIFDDYWWNVDDDPNGIEGPKAGIDAFLTFYAKQYRITHSDYQLHIIKVGF